MEDLVSRSNFSMGMWSTYWQTLLTLGHCSCREGQKYRQLTWDQENLIPSASEPASLVFEFHKAEPET